MEKPNKTGLFDKSIVIIILGVVLFCLAWLLALVGGQTMFLFGIILMLFSLVLVLIGMIAWLSNCVVESRAAKKVAQLPVQPVLTTQSVNKMQDPVLKEPSKATDSNDTDSIHVTLAGKIILLFIGSIMLLGGGTCVWTNVSGAFSVFLRGEFAYGLMLYGFTFLLSVFSAWSGWQIIKSTYKK